MSVNIEAYKLIKPDLDSKKVNLVAVSKFKTPEDIQALYDLGQRDFGENFVQELLLKYEALPKDIRWHYIGHLQSNKAKFIVPFVQLIHGVDSEKLLAEINKQASKTGHTVHCLLQVHIAEEETKFGFDASDLDTIQFESYKNVHISGLMGMASFTDDQNKVRTEFKKLKTVFDKLKTKHPAFSMLSMGMSADYKLAIQEGSNLVRIGSILFGQRDS